MMMTQVLPATVEELNIQQHYKSPVSLLRKSDFEDIPVEKRLKREVSLPNGVENWNISNFDPYLTFDDVLENDFDVLASPEDRLVPESDIHDRPSSISSLTSMMEEKQLTFRNFGVKTISTVRMDSGSTCVSSDHTYFGKSPILTKSLDPEETYQNLDVFFQQVPELTPPEVLPAPSFSPLPSSNSNDSSFQTTVLETLTSISESTQQQMDFASTSTKRLFESISEDDVFVMKQTKYEVEETAGSTRYHEIRRKNNIASKNCRKTRKEKQKDMEQKVAELEQEREKLKDQVRYLEKLIKGHKQYLLNVITQKR